MDCHPSLGRMRLRSDLRRVLLLAYGVGYAVPRVGSPDALPPVSLQTIKVDWTGNSPMLNVLHDGGRQGSTAGISEEVEAATELESDAEPARKHDPTSVAPEGSVEVQVTLAQKCHPTHLRKLPNATHLIPSHPIPFHPIPSHPTSRPIP